MRDNPKVQRELVQAALHFRSAGGLHCESNSLCLAHALRQQREQKRADERRVRPDAVVLPLRQTTALEIGHPEEEESRDARKLLPARRQAHALAVTFHKSGLEEILQFLDLAAVLALAREVAFRRAHDASMRADFHQCAQSVQRQSGLGKEPGKHDSPVSLAAIITVATSFGPATVTDMKTNIETPDQEQAANAPLAAAEYAAVQEILMDQLNVTRNQVTPAALLDADLGADSLDKVEIVMKLEERFNVTIADDEAEPVETVGDLCEALAKTLGR